MTILAKTRRATAVALLIAFLLASSGSTAFAASTSTASEAAVDAPIFVSSLRTSTTPSLLLPGGTVRAELTVRNLSEKKLGGTVEFWIATLWGARVSALPATEVTPLAAGETRTLTAHLEGPGQLLLFTAHATFSPESDAETMSRSAFFPVVPFFALTSAAVLALMLLVVRSALRRREADRVPATVPEALIA